MSKQTQSLLKANIDYDATYANIKGHKGVSLDQTEKGLIRVYLRVGNEKVLILIAATGKIQVFYHSPAELEKTVDFLKHVLVPKPGQKLVLEMIMRIKTLTQEDFFLHESCQIKDDVWAIVEYNNGRRLRG